MGEGVPVAPFEKASPLHGERDRVRGGTSDHDAGAGSSSPCLRKKLGEQGNVHVSRAACLARQHTARRIRFAKLVEDERRAGKSWPAVYPLTVTSVFTPALGPMQPVCRVLEREAAIRAKAQLAPDIAVYVRSGFLGGDDVSGTDDVEP